MYVRIPIKDYKDINPRAFFLGADVFKSFKSGKRRKKITHYNMKTVESLCEGQFCALITDAQYGKLKTMKRNTRFGLSGPNKKKGKVGFFDSKIRRNPNARCIQIGIIDYMDEYKEMEAYDKLFHLHLNKNLHFADLTTIIGAIELEKPIVSNDSHFYWQQSNIQRTYRKRYGDNTKDLLIVTTQSFCKDILPRIEEF